MPHLREARGPEGVRLYAIGDVHGRLDLLRDMHDRIARDLIRRPCAAFRVIHLGDYIDRGPDSAGVIEHLIEFCRDGDAVCLMGNHDHFMRRFFENPVEVASVWLNNGGEEAVASYGVGPLVIHSIKQLRKALETAVPAAHRAFLDEMPLSERHGDYLFVHAGIRPGVALKKQKAVDLFTIREPFLSSEADHGVIVVHGHTVCTAPAIRRNRIGIDTKAYATGRLSCLVLEDAEKGFLEPGGYFSLDLAAAA
jgi:serine/threonine protein phosphatase 1